MKDAGVAESSSARSSLGRRQLLLVYFRAEGPVGTVVALVWCLVALGLAGLLVLFDVAQVTYGRRGVEAIGLTILVSALLWLLAIVEGSELAVARLLGTDPELLARRSAAHTLERIQREPKAFFNGRQALVVTSIVVMTLSVAQIAKIHPTGSGAGRHTGGFLHFWLVEGAFIFGFPNFMVLWLSQLYPKLRAASDAPGRFTLGSYQLVVRACIQLERVTRLGAPTSVLGIIRDRVLLTGAAPEAVAMDSEGAERTSSSRTPATRK